MCILNGATGAGCPAPLDAAIDAPPLDAFPPIHLLSTEPADGATGVPVDAFVIANVDEDVYGYDTTSFVISAFGTATLGSVDYVPSTKQLRFLPDEQYHPNAMYTVNITAAITNMAGFPLGPHQWSFHTGDDTLAPHVMYTVPSDGATQVATDSTIAVRFDEAVTIDTTSFTASDGTTPIAGTITTTGEHIYELQPSAPLPAGTTITASLSSAIQDTSGNTLAPVSFSFTTAP